jgi:lysyl endopeptidase
MYRARDVSRGGLWSRPLPGDTLTLSLTVSSTDAARVQIEIASFQAGYRSLGGVFPDNPHYRQIAAAAQLATCTQNYSCFASSANQASANATVAVLVGNIGQCTGTLLTDTSQDGIPYVLTARHCEGEPGGGDPGAAASVTIFWNAVTPCGSPLASIYDGDAVTQTGATTVVEQQDAWLIQLDAPPVASDANYAGWDATGAAFVGGYAIHHSLGYDKQYVTWNGQAVLITLPVTTLSLGDSSMPPATSGQVRRGGRYSIPAITWSEV